MRPTLLIDLDDTLLVNNIDVFLPAYLQALSVAFAPLIDPSRFKPPFLAAIRQMVRNKRPDCTLLQVFEAAFYPAVGISPVEAQETVDRFYAESFPALKALTSSRPEAIRLVQEAQERGYRLAIATNPLFPQRAILQRLEWAGLPAEEYSFDLIASYETFHFAKPNPAFFAEVLGRLGWPEGPVVTIGDNLENDVAASRRLGLPVYWLSRPGATQTGGQGDPTARGGLSGFLPWLDQAPPEMLQPDYTSTSAMLAVLRSTPAILNNLCGDLDDACWTSRPTEGEWSPTEILCHLRDVEKEVNLPRLQKVLQEDNPFLAGKDTDPWAEERQYFCQGGLQALHKFTASRMELLGLLEGMQPEDWQRPARHAIFGPTRLTELVNIIAGHDRLHIQQVHQDLQALPPS